MGIRKKSLPLKNHISSIQATHCDSIAKTQFIGDQFLVWKKKKKKKNSWTGQKGPPS